MLSGIETSREFSRPQRQHLGVTVCSPGLGQPPGFMLSGTTVPFALQSLQRRVPRTQSQRMWSHPGWTSVLAK